MTGKKKQDRVGVIQAVQTPLGFCVLIMLVMEGILGVLVTRASGTDLTILLIAMTAGFLVMVITGAYIVVRRPPQPEQASVGVSVDKAKPVFKYDVFLSTPMAGVANPEEYELIRKEALQIAESLRKECGLNNVFYAGRHIDHAVDFDVADLSLKDDLKAIGDSKYFVMIYKSKVVSSSLFEAGCAVALGKPSLYFVRDKKHLPFLLQQAEQAFGLIKIYQHETAEDITRMICRHKIELFPSEPS